MKKKVLFLSEAPWYSTGYSVYGNQVLKRLVQNPSLDVAQIAVYASSDDPHVKDFPWKIYGNKPSSNHPQYKTYQVSPSAQFGDFSFNEVLLDFNPHFVLDIRDWWMIEFQQRSPFRNFFKWAIMPTVDAEPQNNQWINTYESADAVFTYSEFGRDVLLNQCDNIKFLDIASPAASECFTPVANKAQHKSQCGLRPDSLIFGTVMRNQKRKLYPDLFESFREFLNLSNRNDVFLYCHTYYPDIGWNIPELLDTYSLSNRVLFTYKCKKCGKITTDFFQDAMQFCKSCGNFTNALVGIGNSITEKEVAQFMQEIAEERGVSVESLNDFAGYINGSIKNLTPEQLQIWAAKQTYIALGFALVAAATEEIDATPMEGFKPDAVDEALGLKELGLHSAVAVTLGYRDAANDYLSGAKKVRRASEKLIIRK